MPRQIAPIAQPIKKEPSTSFRMLNLKWNGSYMGTAPDPATELRLSELDCLTFHEVLRKVVSQVLFQESVRIESEIAQCLAGETTAMPTLHPGFEVIHRREGVKDEIVRRYLYVANKRDIHGFDTCEDCWGGADDCENFCNASLIKNPPSDTIGFILKPRFDRFGRHLVPSTQLLPLFDGDLVVSIGDKAVYRPRLSQEGAQIKGLLLI